jgi:hypothetical protein
VLRLATSYIQAYRVRTPISPAIDAVHSVTDTL